jgi:membrane fusion protein, multidrug efflux system
MSTSRKRLGLLVSLLAFASVLVTGALVAYRVEQHPRTDDAYLQAYIINVAPDVSGRIVELDVQDDQKVKKGQKLFQIDPEPYRLKAEQALTQLRGLEAQLAVVTNQVAAQTSKAEAAERSAEAAAAQLKLATNTVQRSEPLVGRGYVTEQQIDQAHTNERAAQASLQAARLEAAEARQAINSVKPTEESVQNARATLALAERDLNKTLVLAPCDGRITALQVASGEFASAGHSLFTIIDTRHWYAIGNFRETDLARIKPGQRAIVYVMARPNRPLHGDVQSIGWGVTSGTGYTVGSLPNVERTLNWVRIAARFPVRIELDSPPEDLMRVGASAVVEIEK